MSEFAVNNRNQNLKVYSGQSFKGNEKVTEPIENTPSYDEGSYDKGQAGMSNVAKAAIAIGVTAAGVWAGHKFLYKPSQAKKIIKELLEGKAEGTLTKEAKEELVKKAAEKTGYSEEYIGKQFDKNYSSYMKPEKAGTGAAKSAAEAAENGAKAETPKEKNPETLNKNQEPDPAPTPEVKPETPGQSEAQPEPKKTPGATPDNPAQPVPATTVGKNLAQPEAEPKIVPARGKSEPAPGQPKVKLPLTPAELRKKTEEESLDELKKFFEGNNIPVIVKQIKINSDLQLDQVVLKIDTEKFINYLVSSFPEQIRKKARDLYNQFFNKNKSMFDKDFECSYADIISEKFMEKITKLFNSQDVKELNSQIDKLNKSVCGKPVSLKHPGRTAKSKIPVDKPEPPATTLKNDTKPEELELPEFSEPSVPANPEVKPTNNGQNQSPTNNVVVAQEGVDYVIKNPGETAELSVAVDKVKSDGQIRNGQSDVLSQAGLSLKETLERQQNGQNRPKLLNSSNSSADKNISSVQNARQKPGRNNSDPESGFDLGPEQKFDLGPEQNFGLGPKTDFGLGTETGFGLGNKTQGFGPGGSTSGFESGFNSSGSMAGYGSDGMNKGMFGQDIMNPADPMNAYDPTSPWYNYLNNNGFGNSFF